jgi:hypothetical protein
VAAALPTGYQQILSAMVACFGATHAVHISSNRQQLQPTTAIIIIIIIMLPIKP